MSELPSSTELGRALAARRRRVVKTCAVCGTRIEGIGKRLYCSPACTTRAYYRRKRMLPLADADQPRAHKRAE